jgi:hypothetical protein
MLERDARGGTRYIEIIKAQFGVVSPDSRLQRPEYLGGRSNIKLSVFLTLKNSSFRSRLLELNLTGSMTRSEPTGITGI